MIRLSKAVTRSVGLFFLLIAAGCAGGRGTHQFDPIPLGDVSSADLQPADTVKGNYAPLVFPNPLPERVEYEIKDIQQRYPKNFQTGLDRAQKYLPYAYDVFGREGLPQDLVWLAMVESQFHPKAVSRAGASGMWQFMPAAGRRFGLRMDTYVDERFNWKRETHAAVEYLKALYKHFNGDWALAISAYNMGEGGLGRVIKAHGDERNFWELVESSASTNSMREETQKYYPRLLATVLVAKNPEKYGFVHNASPPEDSVEAPVDGMYDLSELDTALGYASGTLSALNPGLVQGVTPPNGSYEILVPRADREEFILALNTVQQKPHNAGKKSYGHNSSPNVNVTVASNGVSHKVKRGDTIAGIARKHGVNQNELMTFNGVKSAHSLKIGQTLRIPGKTETPTAPAPEIARQIEVEVASAPKEEELHYTVKKGDTLSSIATKHKISIASLQQWNNMGKSTSLKVGENLILNVPAENVVIASVEKDSTKTTNIITPGTTYTVQKGDTLSSIASKQGVKVATLQEWNGLKDSNIKLGQKLKVATPAESMEEIAETVTASASGYHTVQAGEFPAAIAKAHSMSVEQLLALNHLDKDSVLHVGDKLAVSDGKVSPVEIGAIQMASTTEVKTKDKESISSSVKSEKTTHKVAKGDTPGVIAKKYGVTTRDLLAWNNLSPKSTINIGQELIVYPVAKAAASEAESDTTLAKEVQVSESKAETQEEVKQKTETLTHVVAKGQTPWNIAQEYGVRVDDLQRWNKWNPNHVLRVGDKVTVVKGE